MPAAAKAASIIGVRNCQKHERITPITQLHAIDGLRPKIGLILPVFRVSDYADDAALKF